MSWPASPSVEDTYTVEGKTWVYQGDNVWTRAPLSPPATSFLELTDTPNDYTDLSLHLMQVNQAEDALEPIETEGLPILADEEVWTGQAGGVVAKHHNLIIPTPRIHISNYDISFSKIGVIWSQNNREFLKYNPEIWLFRRVSKKQHNRSHYAHEPHKSGIKYPGSSFYSGEVWWSGIGYPSTGEVPFDVETEFPLTSNSGQIQYLTTEQDGYNIFWMYYHLRDLVAEPPETIMPTIAGGPYIFSDYRIRSRTGVGNRRNRETQWGPSPSPRLLTSLKVAIVIDNPNPEESNPKLIGPLSETFFLQPTRIWAGPTEGTQIGFRAYTSVRRPRITV